MCFCFTYGIDNLGGLWTPSNSSNIHKHLYAWKKSNAFERVVGSGDLNLFGHFTRHVFEK